MATLTTASSAPAVRPRLESVDVLRGVIMIVMALDHTRDYLGVAGQNPTNLATASAALFFTRWITHFCAPVFFLLTGTAAYLSLRRKSRPKLSTFLLTRGLWLVFLEPVVVRCLVYQFNFDFHVTALLVLWALGWCMVALSALMWLPTPLVVSIGALMIAGHNLLDGVRSANAFWSILHQPGIVLNTPGHVVFVAYPLIPWVGVTAVGYGLGRIYEWETARRRTWLLRTGLALTAAFLAIRGINVYGDPARWTVQPTAGFTMLSFLNTTKYPPSLLFLLMTLGPALLLLRAIDGRTPRLLRPALVFGRVPLFYYVVHFALVHAIAAVVCGVVYGSMRYAFESPDLARFPFTFPPGWGFSLPMVYVWWVLVVASMYLPCRWFADVKQRNPGRWLSYL
jgi:uncharacterized membrane protein